MYPNTPFSSPLLNQSPSPNPKKNFGLKNLLCTNQSLSKQSKSRIWVYLIYRFRLSPANFPLPPSTYVQHRCAFTIHTIQYNPTWQPAEKPQHRRSEAGQRERERNLKSNRGRKKTLHGLSLPARLNKFFLWQQSLKSAASASSVNPESPRAPKPGVRFSPLFLTLLGDGCILPYRAQILTRNHIAKDLQHGFFFFLSRNHGFWIKGCVELVLWGFF